MYTIGTPHIRSNTSRLWPLPLITRFHVHWQLLHLFIMPSMIFITSTNLEPFMVTGWELPPIRAMVLIGLFELIRGGAIHEEDKCTLHLTKMADGESTISETANL